MVISWSTDVFNSIYSTYRKLCTPNWPRLHRTSPCLYESIEFTVSYSCTARLSGEIHVALSLKNNHLLFAKIVSAPQPTLMRSELRISQGEASLVYIAPLDGLWNSFTIEEIIIFWRRNKALKDEQSVFHELKKVHMSVKIFQRW